MGCYSYIAQATPTPTISLTPTQTPTISLTPTQTPTPTPTGTPANCLDPDVEGYSFDSPQ
jgi:endoglucanase